MSEGERLETNEMNPLTELPTDPGGSDEATPEKWQALTSKWNALAGLEAQIETLRLAMEGLRFGWIPGHAG